MLKQLLDFQESELFIIKLGSSAVTLPDGGVNKIKLLEIVQDLFHLQHHLKKKIIVITSGAIHTARGLYIFQKPALKDYVLRKDIQALQALSSLGQPILMSEYMKAAYDHGLICSQVLLTHEDFKSRQRFFNAQNTIRELLTLGVIPILNENDVVSFDEITVGDNDQLTSMVCGMVVPHYPNISVMMLTGAPGLLSGPPEEKDSSLMSVIEYEADLPSITFGEQSSMGRGGMEGKLSAIRKITQQGIPVKLGSYRLKNPLNELLKEQQGSFFVPGPKTKAKKNWILAAVRPKAKLVIDEGAKTALQKKASLLPSGIKEVHGPFQRGDVVAIVYKGAEIGYGVVEYNSPDMEIIKGRRGPDIPQVLGHYHSPEAINRDNLVIKKL